MYQVTMVAAYLDSGASEGMLLYFQIPISRRGYLPQLASKGRPLARLEFSIRTIRRREVLPKRVYSSYE